jgi:pyridoxamine 5'-phosphate oxidase
MLNDMVLDERTVDADPIRQFGMWFREAADSGAMEPTAMALATATPEGAPSVRMVLLKGFAEDGFVFFTNYESRKGRELASNPRAALCLYWAPLERQVRITGVVERTTEEESNRYFDSRPWGSRLSAAFSPQSSVISGRHVLESDLDRLRRESGDQGPPRPPHWGGFRVIPEVIEFWQGRPDRLHDRIQYRREDGHWVIERLAP